MAARVLEHEHHAPVMAHEGEGARRPGGIELVGERIFVFEPPEAHRRLLCEERCQYQDRGWIARLSAPIEDELAAFPKGLEIISGQLRHERPCPH